MVVRLLVLAAGFGLASAGGISIIAFLNYIPAGLSIVEFLIFLLQRSESALFILGCILITGSIYWPENS
ncbi:hypothetical protein [Salibacterium halotolerans]|uniref:Uncharacterized protein n=1 Tax=Salibacterium halotolerans TaxID=1884432 RepID=A0A1I5T8N1_9BACI|nr:hypothetical protein [Salibacterium halotolerans]SFP79399.1 hypothetical protein SAMN05518683_11057 [Salibacterium halotolerans]